MSIFGEMQRVFLLKHPNFIIDPETDWVCYFGRNDAKDNLRSIIEKSFKAQIPPKIVLWGSWGIGKTQTLYHFIKTVFETHSSPIYVECPEFPRKTNFIDFYSVLMNRIRVDRLVPLVRKYASIRQSFANVQEPDFKHLCQNVLTMASGEALSTAWKWLTGQSLSNNEKLMLGVSEDQLSTTMAINILGDIGEFFLTAEGKPLVFCVDEAHRLGNVEEESDHERTFVQALRKISTRTYPVGFIFAVGAGDESKFPHMFVLGEVKDRIGDYYIELTPLDDTSLTEMVTGIIRYVRDGWDVSSNSFGSPGKEVGERIKALQAKGLNASADTFPFTQDAIEQILAYFQADDMAERRTPREICDLLNDCSTEEDAIKQGYVDGNVVAKLARSRSTRRRPAVAEES